MDNKERLVEIQKFLENLGFETKIPDFIGAWSSKAKTNSFYGIINGSYVLGYIVDEKSSTVIDTLGISILDNPFTTDSFLIQKYSEEKSHEETAGEKLRYYPNLAVKKREFPQKFPIFSTWEGDVVTGRFDIVGEGLCGYFLLTQNDGSQEFLEASESIRKELAEKLMV